MGKVGRYGDFTVELVEQEKREVETSAECLDRLLRELVALRNKPTVFRSEYVKTINSTVASR